MYLLNHPIAQMVVVTAKITVSIVSPSFFVYHGCYFSFLLRSLSTPKLNPLNRRIAFSLCSVGISFKVSAIPEPTSFFSSINSFPDIVFFTIPSLWHELSSLWLYCTCLWHCCQGVFYFFLAFGKFLCYIHHRRR